MLESLLNDDQAKAEELFHDYVVSRSRDIYESLIESEIEEEDEVDESDDKDADDKEGDEDLEEGSATITINDDGPADEGDIEIGGDATDDLEGDLDAEIDDDDLEEKEPAELFQDLEGIVDELQAKFNEMNGEGGDEFGDEEEGEMEFGDEEDEEEIEDDFDKELATVREYVEKIGSPKMGDNGANTNSPVAGKNDMGGSNANMTKGGKSKGEGTKRGLLQPSTQEDNAGNVNVPGGNAGKTSFKKKEPGHGAEKKGSGDNGANTTSVVARSKR